MCVCVCVGGGEGLSAGWLAHGSLLWRLALGGAAPARPRAHPTARRLTQEVAPFAATADRLEDFQELNALHWHGRSGQYRDWGLHTEGVRMEQARGRALSFWVVPAAACVCVCV